MQLKIALAQINVTVGAMPENGKKVIKAIDKAHRDRADIILFPELTLCAYPLRTWSLKKTLFPNANRHWMP
ncbi:MAG: nitrilase-related carbon-nitrogen hydrolase [Candidatus Marinimicrobia bacterium]|nr:nitrilase-related carbon-nitrogen hydrolase [Candidatus Neomarinimicrobiota bacterium]